MSRKSKPRKNKPRADYQNLWLSAPTDGIPPIFSGIAMTAVIARISKHGPLTLRCLKDGIKASNFKADDFGPLLARNLITLASIKIERRQITVISLNEKHPAIKELTALGIALHSYLEPLARPESVAPETPFEHKWLGTPHFNDGFFGKRPKSAVLMMTALDTEISQHGICKVVPFVPEVGLTRTVTRLQTWSIIRRRSAASPKVHNMLSLNPDWPHVALFREFVEALANKVHPENIGYRRSIAEFDRARGYRT